MTQVTSPLVQKYAAVLSEEGYTATVDAEGDLYFKVEGGHYFLRVNEDDTLSFILLYPNFYAVKNDTDRRRALEVASEVNTRVKLVKVFVANNDTQASVEVLLANESDFRSVFLRALGQLRAGVTRFREIVRERAEWPQNVLKA